VASDTATGRARAYHGRLRRIGSPLAFRFAFVARLSEQLARAGPATSLADFSALSPASRCYTSTNR
jgi:hypothetical protein